MHFAHQKHDFGRLKLCIHTKLKKCVDKVEGKQYTNKADPRGTVKLSKQFRIKQERRLRKRTLKIEQQTNLKEETLKFREQGITSESEIFLKKGNKRTQPKEYKIREVSRLKEFTGQVLTHRKVCLNTNLIKSLILAQDERWRHA